MNESYYMIHILYDTQTKLLVVSTGMSSGQLQVDKLQLTITEKLFLKFLTTIVRL